MVRGLGTPRLEHKGHSVFSSSLSHERVRRDRQTELGEAGRRAWHLRHPTPAQRCPGLYPLGLPVPLKNAGSSSLTERQPLAPLPGHTLVPGPSIFGPPGPESDKKGTAAGHVCPRGTRCSIKGHGRFCDLSDGHRDLRTERGRLLLRGCHARSPLPGLGKAAGHLRSARVQTAERPFLGSCSFEGRGAPGKSQSRHGGFSLLHAQQQPQEGRGNPAKGGSLFKNSSCPTTSEQ